MLSLDEILTKFCEDLMKKGKVSAVQQCIQNDQKSRSNLVLLILDNYIAYPHPPSLTGFNYCILSRIFPWLEPLTSLVCA